MRTWQLQQAESRLSEVIDEALREGPQLITRRGVEMAVVMSYKAFRELHEARGSLVEFFRASPLVGVDLDLK